MHVPASTDELIAAWRHQRRCIRRQIDTILRLADELVHVDPDEKEKR